MRRRRRIWIGLVVGVGMALGLYGLSLFAQRARAQARLADRLIAIRALALGMLMYASDWDERLPPASKPNDPYFWVKPLERQEREQFWGMIVLCATAWGKRYDHRDPSAAAFVLEHPDRVFRYHADPGLAGMALRDFDDPGNTLVAWDKPPYELGRRCCAFVDGHIKALPEDEWQRALRRSKRLIAQAKQASGDAHGPGR